MKSLFRSATILTLVLSFAPFSAHARGTTSSGGFAAMVKNVLRCTGVNSSGANLMLTVDKYDLADEAALSLYEVKADQSFQQLGSWDKVKMSLQLQGYLPRLHLKTKALDLSLPLGSSEHQKAAELVLSPGLISSDAPSETLALDCKWAGETR